MVHQKQSPTISYVAEETEEAKEARDLLYPIELPDAMSQENTNRWTSKPIGAAIAKLKDMPTYKDESVKLWDAEKLKKTKEAELAQAREKAYEKVKVFTTSRQQHVANMRLQVAARKFIYIYIFYLC